MQNILVLCTGNSARSIIGEFLLRHHGAGRVTAVSAGSFPKGAVHPMALHILAERGVDVADARSKSWDEFAAPGAAPIDLVITVCDNAAGETCPAFPGRVMRAHWGIADPAAVAEADQYAAFSLAYDQLAARIDALLALPFETMDPATLQARLDAIGLMDGATHG